MARICVISTIIGLFVVTQLIEYGGTVVEITSSVIQVWLYVSLGNMYFWTQLNLCYLMWTKHRFEFYRHSFNMIALLIVTPVSTWISSIFSWLWLLKTICDGDENMLN